MPLFRRKSSLSSSSSSSCNSNSIKSSYFIPFTCTHFLKLKPQKRNSSIKCSSSSIPPVSDARKLPDVGTLYRRFLKVAKPYWSSEDKVQARLQLAAVFALTLGTTGISVAFSFLGRDFYNALANKDQNQFMKQLLYYLGGFSVGIPGLVNLNFLQEKKEADFRYGLVRVRENAESIAFYSGEENELQMLVQRFSSAFQNLTRLLVASRNLDFFTSGYRYFIQILPAAVVAPLYFSGKIEFGVINQSVSAFNHILGDVSLIVYQFQAISAFSAVIDRLGEFDDLLDSNISENLTDSTSNVYVVYQNVTSPTNQTLLDSSGSLTEGSSKKLVDLEHLTLVTPEKSTILMDLTLSINEKDNLLITGPSGSGKTSLLRAMAGLWTSGSGKITFYVKETDDHQSVSTHENAEESDPFKSRTSRGIIFLPQKPYMVLGSLRQQLLYPTWAEIPTLDGVEQTGCPPFLLQTEGSGCVFTRSLKPTTEDLIKVLEDVRLGYLVPRFGLDSTYEWSSILSLGEQQRLAFARLLLAKPYLILLDESTSALDEDNEDHLYRLIEAADVTYVSIGHRRSLINYHSKVLNIKKMDPQSPERNWTIKPINQEARIRLSEIGL